MGGRVTPSEDTHWTVEQLADKGFDANLLEAINCLTKEQGETYDHYINRVKENAIARKVEIADLEDKM